MADLQQYISLYFAEKDEKYLKWFLHYYEPRINTVIMQTVQETAMQGHFSDLKQAYIFGICKSTIFQQAFRFSYSKSSM